VQEDDPAIAYLDDAVALELAHDLRDGLAGRGDHVRQILLGQVNIEQDACAVFFTKFLAQVEKQRGKPGCDLPVQEDL
jgi:hypothetical protein